MKSILKKIAGLAVAAALAFGMAGCSNPSAPADPTGPDYSKCVVGDFILKDGTILSKDETPASGTVAAVIVRAAADGKSALGVGIVHNRSGLLWCIEEASGCEINISDLVGDKTSDYMDGSDSWDILVEKCNDLKEATEETFETVAEKYPAFNYCRKYGENNGLKGDLANGWYLPTVAELYTIYQNKETVDASLIKAGGSNFGDSVYWSCCQHPSTNDDARVLNFTGGNRYGDYKHNSYHYVCSVRAFN